MITSENNKPTIILEEYTQNSGNAPAQVDEEVLQQRLTVRPLFTSEN